MNILLLSTNIRDFSVTASADELSVRVLGHVYIQCPVELSSAVVASAVIQDIYVGSQIIHKYISGPTDEALSIHVRKVGRA